MLKILFWFCLVTGLYPYLLYPLIASAMARLFPRKINARPISPKVSILISAFNEARHIEATVRNKLSQDYDGWVDVWVASDASVDGTDEIVTKLSEQDSRVHLYRQEPRQGKTSALNALAQRARGDILVFSDANSEYAPETLRRLLEPFSDPGVGYVTGSMVYANPDGSMVGDGCSAYMRYENWLRRTESSLGSVVGVDGGVDAVRRELYVPMRADQLPDFVLPLNVVEQGYRAVYAPSAFLKEEALNNNEAEFKMRVRVTLRALWALKDKAALMFGRAGALFAWQLISHKLLRYLSFIPLTLAFLSSALLAMHSEFYAVLFVLYSITLALAWAGFKGVNLSVARYAYYFSLLNIASATATWKFLRGQKQVLWTPRVG